MLFCNLVWTSFADHFCQHFHAFFVMPSPPRKVNWQWKGNELACRPISKIFLKSSPALGPGHVDCQWSENGSRRRRGGSQQAYSKQALKARALFLPLLNGFLALDPQFQRQYCFRQQLRSKGKTLDQSINGYCQMSQYGCLLSDHC